LECGASRRFRKRGQAAHSKRFAQFEGLTIRYQRLSACNS
jgi:hypothetical protein